MRISIIQSKGLHTAYLDQNNLSIISSLTITPTSCLTRIRFKQISLKQIFKFLLAENMRFLVRPTEGAHMI